MSIARAFTTKRAKRDSPDAIQRSLTTKQSGSIRNKISSPVELLSTTNMLSYNAPDLHSALSPSSSSTNSTSEASDSDHKSISSVSTPPSSPDSEKGSVPEPNHLSCYFNTPPTGLAAAKSAPDLKDTTAPQIPTRAPSHTKRSHESLSHKKSSSKASSLSHKSSAPAIGMGHKTSSSTIRTSLQMFESLRSQATSTNNTSPLIPSSESTRVHAKQTSISTTSSQSRYEAPAPTPAKLRPIVGLPARPNQQTPPMQSRARSRTNSLSKQQKPQNGSAGADLKSYVPHPFGNELAQVTELAEEYSGGKVGFEDEERTLMAEKGLCRFSAEDYMSEIQGLFVKAFGEVRQKVGVDAVWI